MSRKDRDSVDTSLFTTLNSPDPSLTTILPSRSMQIPRGSKLLSSSNGFDVVTVLVKHLNAIVAYISDQDVVIRINKEMVGIK